MAGDAEATAIKAKDYTFRKIPSLVALTAPVKWDVVLPTSMVPGLAVSFVNLRK